MTAQTRLVALLGDPVGHSRSPGLHNSAFRALGLDFAYAAFRVRPPDLADAVAGLRALGFAGANVTIPHKEAVLAHLDALTPAARAIGAANTVVVREVGDGSTRLEGDNTDAGGFLDGLAPHADAVEGAEAVVFGAGGSARAVAYALLTATDPARLTIVARSPERAALLASGLAGFDPGGALRVAAPGDARALVRRARLVVNATPAGMRPHETETPHADADDFGPDHVVYDLVYAPAQTRLLREAAARGARAVGGLVMLGGQAARSFERWTGQPLPAGVLAAWLEAGE